MNRKQIALSVILADFVALTAYAVYHYGYTAFLTMMTANAITVQVGIDLILALSMVTIWMVRDARARGWSPLPYVLLTLTLGSIGPMLYFIRRLGTEPATEPHFAAHPARG